MKHSEACERFAGVLQAAGLPFVSVADARRAILPDAEAERSYPPGLGRFDTVVYGRSCNLLVSVGVWTPKRWAILKEWERLFGDGFRAVFAVPAETIDRWGFRTGRGTVTGPEALRDITSDPKWWA